MKLISKLTLFITLSKLALVLVFVLALPYLVEDIAKQYTDDYLRQQKQKVLEMIEKDGVDVYLEGGDSYGSYTMLKEEYISLEPLSELKHPDTIYTDQRIIEQDTLSYRILQHSFHAGSKDYLLEVGKTVATIGQYNRPLQRIATSVLLGLILITLIIELLYTRFLMRPLGKIIRTKIRNRKFPFNEDPAPIQTSTSDFIYLDRSLIKLMNQIHEAFEKEREFTANASHELMTPIGILQNKIENLMDEPETSPYVQERLIGMQKTLNRLKRIVHSLLLISRIDNDQFSKNDSVNLSVLIDELLDEIGHRLLEKQISLDVSVPAHVDLANCNRDLIFQMLYNLVNNAIRYNKDEGHIEIHGVIEEGGGFILQISDSGIGIPLEDQFTIFNRFKKSNMSEESGGYGLGLSIVKSIADYHNIHISVKSQPGNGSRFVLEIPGQMLVLTEL